MKLLFENSFIAIKHFWKTLFLFWLENRLLIIILQTLYKLQKVNCSFFLWITKALKVKYYRFFGWKKLFFQYKSLPICIISLQNSTQPSCSWQDNLSGGYQDQCSAGQFLQNLLHSFLLLSKERKSSFLSQEKRVI